MVCTIKKLFLSNLHILVKVEDVPGVPHRYDERKIPTKRYGTKKEVYWESFVGKSFDCCSLALKTIGYFYDNLGYWAVYMAKRYPQFLKFILSCNTDAHNFTKI